MKFNERELDDLVREENCGFIDSYIEDHPEVEQKFNGLEAFGKSDEFKRSLEKVATDPQYESFNRELDNIGDMENIQEFQEKRNEIIERRMDFVAQKLSEYL